VIAARLSAGRTRDLIAVMSVRLTVNSSRAQLTTYRFNATLDISNPPTCCSVTIPADTRQTVPEVGVAFRLEGKPDRLSIMVRTHSTEEGPTRLQGQRPAISRPEPHLFDCR